MRHLMQYVFVIAVGFFISKSPLLAQVGINSDGSDPNSSSILDIKSTDKGLLIPRMTIAQRDNIISPATGLMVYITDDNSFYFFNGIIWQKVNLTQQVSDTDNDTKIQVEENTDEDIIRFDIGGSEKWLMQGARLENRNSGNSVFIGESSGQNDDLVDNRNVFIGYQSGQSNTSGRFNVFTGSRSGLKNTSGWQNVFVGNQAGTENTTGGYNTFIGNDAGRLNTTAISNTYLGWGAGRNGTTGSYNVFVGDNAGYDNTTGGYNVYLGRRAGEKGTTANSNVIIGLEAGRNNTSGNNNIYLGRQAGVNNTTGGSNIFIGAYAGMNETGSNKLYIENSGSSFPLIYGEFDNDLIKINGQFSANAIGVGTDTPSKALELVENTDNLEMPLLVRNKSGIDTGGGAVGIGFHVEPQANREPKAALVHERLGNYGRGSFHFLLNNSENTDGVSLNDAKVTITQDGKMGIGTKTPSAVLDIIGDLELNGTLNINNAFSFPTTDGTNGQVLVTNGSGALSWNAFTDNDNQTLSLNTNTLSLTNGGSVDLSTFLDADDLGNHTATQNIQLGSNYISNDGDNEGISIGANGDIVVKSTSPNNRPAVFESDYDGGAYIEVNNNAGTRALFGPGGGGFSGSTSDVLLANWSNGGLKFYTNAQERVNISNTGQFQISGDLKLVNGNQGANKILVSDANGLGAWTDAISINSLKITGGNPAEGKVLTTDADGDVVLEEPADRIVYRFDQTSLNQDANGLSGWHVVSDYTDALNVSIGDVVTIRMTFGTGIAGGSGTDELKFRVNALGASGCPHQPGGETNYLNIYENNRNRDIQTAIQHTFTSTCNGSYQFALQCDYSNVDDNVVVDQVQITAVKY